MVWKTENTQIVTHNNEEWAVDLLTGETRFETKPVGKALHGVMASAHRDGNWQFKVAMWVPEDKVSASADRVMVEAKRRISAGNWQTGDEYEIETQAG